MERLGVAVIGAGYWGPNLVRAFSGSADVDLRWVCDLDEARAQRAVGRYSRIDVTTDLDRVLSDPSVDAVCIATPAASHLAIGLAAVDAGKHILVEKPVATSLADAVTLVDASRDRGLTLMCDHVQCFAPAVMAMRDLVNEGLLGDLQYADAVRINLGLVQPDVDVIWDLAPHDLAIFDFVLGDQFRPEGVAATGSDPIGAGRACIGYVSLPLAGGAMAHVNVNWLSPSKFRRVIVAGSRRMLVWDDLNPTQRLQLFDKGIEIGEPQDVSADERARKLISYRIGDVVAPALPEHDALSGMVKEFVAAVSEGREPITGSSSGLRVLSVLEAASRSQREHGRLVALDDWWESDPARTELTAGTRA